MKKSATLPCIITVDDYHNFYGIQQAMQVINHKIKVDEIDRETVCAAFDEEGLHGNYYGIVYEGRLPSKTRIVELLTDDRLPIYSL
jgi:hypothetical protein